jgi:hypothetical protein
MANKRRDGEKERFWRDVIQRQAVMRIHSLVGIRIRVLLNRTIVLVLGVSHR